MYLVPVLVLIGNGAELHKITACSVPVFTLVKNTYNMLNFPEKKRLVLCPVSIYVRTCTRCIPGVLVLLYCAAVRVALGYHICFWDVF